VRPAPHQKQYWAIAMNKLPAQQALELLDRDIAEEEGRLASHAIAPPPGRNTT
jgi:hypothetical protein